MVRYGAPCRSSTYMIVITALFIHRVAAESDGYAAPRALARVCSVKVPKINFSATCTERLESIQRLDPKLKSVHAHTFCGQLTHFYHHD